MMAAWLSACGGGTPVTDAGSTDAGAIATDAGATDAGATDAGTAIDTWTNFASGFFATYCTECHDTSPKDFRLLADVRANATVTACGVATSVLSGCGPFPPPRQFPVGSGPFPSDAERDRLVAWIQAGMPE